MRSIAVVNQKGGCGKTITAINLSAFLAQNGRRVLLIDMDPQGHATLGMQTDVAHPAKTISDVLLRELTNEEISLRDVRLNLRENLDLVPADILLSAVPEELAAVDGRENKLAEALDEVRRFYHYAIVDCPPQVGLLTFNALIACSEAIIPIDPSFFSLHGVGKLLETLDVLARRTLHKIDSRALITLFTGRTKFVKEVAENIRKNLSNRVFETVIRYSVKLAEAASHGLPISAYCQGCVGFQDYQLLAREVLSQEMHKPAGEILDENESEVGVQERSILQRLRLPSAPIPTRDGVVFTLDAPGANRVQVAGDFNAWMPDGGEMRFRNGMWCKLISLAPGRYRYRYVVDGCWQSDPLNSLTEPSPYGDYDSVVVLDENRLDK